MSFASLGLSESILKALSEKGYQQPTPVQQKAIPAILAGRDVMAAAQTGTGKTAGFTLPILENLSKGNRAGSNQARALVLTPTRELAAQVAESVQAYGKFLPLSSTVVFGGVKINPQMMRLRRGADILIATPGRLWDLYQQNAVKFKHLEILVLDEADRMLDMGFIHDIRKIISVLPKVRQNLLFSATFSDDIRKLAKTIIHNPVEFSVTPRNATAKSVTQWLCPVDKKRKPALLSHLIKTENWQQVLVFSRTKFGANRLAAFLEKAGISSAPIHGNKSQNARIKALADFKAGKIRALVATDIAARGLDIDQLPQVVNVDLPNVPEDYVHRIGRTGRAGASGQAISLVSADEIKQLCDIEILTQKTIERRYVDGFEPVHELPESSRNSAPKSPKKVKKTKPSKRSGNTSEKQLSKGKTPKSHTSRTSTPKSNASKTNAPQNKAPTQRRSRSSQKSTRRPQQGQP